MKAIKPIETEYQGVLYRSRAEARRAVWFDFLRIDYRYEPEGFDFGNGLRYLPDFWLPEFGTWLEVKGKPPMLSEWRKATHLAQLAFGDVVIDWSDFSDHWLGNVRFWIDGNSVLWSKRDTEWLDIDWTLLRAANSAAKSARFERVRHG